MSVNLKTLAPEQRTVLKYLAERRWSPAAFLNQEALKSLVYRGMVDLRSSRNLMDQARITNDGLEAIGETP